MQWLHGIGRCLALVYKYTSISRTSISRIFDRSEKMSGTGMSVVVLYPISRNHSFDKPDIFRRETELNFTYKAANALHRAHSRPF